MKVEWVIFICVILFGIALGLLSGTKLYKVAKDIIAFGLIFISGLAFILFIIKGVIWIATIIIAFFGKVFS